MGQARIRQCTRHDVDAVIGLERQWQQEAEAAYAVQSGCPAIPAVEGIVATRPERWARRTGSTHG